MSAPPLASGTKEVSAVNVSVLIPEVPLSIAPNPDVIEPESNAPVVSILLSPAAGAADISDNTSDALLPSTAVPSIRKKSLSATP